MHVPGISMDSEPKDITTILCFSYFSYLHLAPREKTLENYEKFHQNSVTKAKNGKSNSN